MSAARRRRILEQYEDPRAAYSWEDYYRKLDAYRAQQRGLDAHSTLAPETTTTQTTWTSYLPQEGLSKSAKIGVAGTTVGGVSFGLWARPRIKRLREAYRGTREAVNAQTAGERPPGDYTGRVRRGIARTGRQLRRAAEGAGRGIRNAARGVGGGVRDVARRGAVGVLRRAPAAFAKGVKYGRIARGHIVEKGARGAGRVVERSFQELSLPKTGRTAAQLFRIRGAYDRLLAELPGYYTAGSTYARDIVERGFVEGVQKATRELASETAETTLRGLARLSEESVKLLRTLPESAVELYQTEGARAFRQQFGERAERAMRIGLRAKERAVEGSVRTLRQSIERGRAIYEDMFRRGGQRAIEDVARPRDIPRAMQQRFDELQEAVDHPLENFHEPEGFDPEVAAGRRANLARETAIQQARETRMQLEAAERRMAPGREAMEQRAEELGARTRGGRLRGGNPVSRIGKSSYGRLVEDLAPEGRSVESLSARERGIIAKGKQRAAVELKPVNDTTPLLADDEARASHQVKNVFERVEEPAAESAARQSARGLEEGALKNHPASVESRALRGLEQRTLGEVTEASEQLGLPKVVANTALKEETAAAARAGRGVGALVGEVTLGGAFGGVLGIAGFALDIWSLVEFIKEEEKRKEIHRQETEIQKSFAVSSATQNYYQGALRLPNLATHGRSFVGGGGASAQG